MYLHPSKMSIHLDLSLPKGPLVPQIPPMATSNCSIDGRSNCSRQDELIMTFQG